MYDHSEAPRWAVVELLIDRPGHVSYAGGFVTTHSIRFKCPSCGKESIGKVRTP